MMGPQPAPGRHHQDSGRQIVRGRLHVVGRARAAGRQEGRGRPGLKPVPPPSHGRRHMMVRAPDPGRQEGRRPRCGSLTRSGLHRGVLRACRAVRGEPGFCMTRCRRVANGCTCMISSRKRDNTSDSRVLQVEPLATCHTHVDRIGSLNSKTVTIRTRNPTTWVGKDPLAAKMERGRLGLMSTSASRCKR